MKKVHHLGAFTRKTIDLCRSFFASRQPSRERRGELKRAQTSVEYIILAAVVIILATIFIGLTRGGLDSFSVSQETSRKYWTTADVGILGQQHEGSVLRLSVINNLASDINIGSITLTNSRNAQTFTVGSIILSPGEIVTYNLTHTHDTGNLGKRYSYDLSFVYTDLEANTQRTFYGQAPIVGTVTS